MPVETHELKACMCAAIHVSKTNTYHLDNIFTGCEHLHGGACLGGGQEDG